MHLEDSLPKMDRRDFLKLGGAGLAGAVLLGASGGALAKPEGEFNGKLRKEFEAAAEEYGVPLELLMAMGYVNTLWEMPPPDASDYKEGDLHGRGAYGIMQLVQNPWTDTLGRAASLIGLPEDDLKKNRAANIRGAAALLADLHGKEQPQELNGWQEAVAEYGDTELYANAVFYTLEEGAKETTLKGEALTLAPEKSVEVPKIDGTMGDYSTEGEYSTQGHRRGHNTDYRKAVWRPASRSNYTSARRERSHPINRVIIHVAQGSYVSTINWFQDPRAQVSAHYVINRKGRVAQCVRNKNIAWHAGNWFYNTRSIGIEHEGYVGNPKWFTERMYRSSARLVAYLIRRHNIPVNRKYIMGHNRVPGSTHTDPGRHWKWKKYMRYIRQAL